MQSPSGLQPTSLSFRSLFGVGTCFTIFVKYFDVSITDVNVVFCR